MKRATAGMVHVVLLASCLEAREYRPAQVPAEERAATMAALTPPKRTRPVVAVLAANDGTETTDLLVPVSVWVRSGVMDVHVVGTQRGRVTLMPALAVEATEDLADFDAQFPDGADYAVVPALHDASNDRVLHWVREQQEKGATVVGVCSGAQVLSKAGLLRDRRATGHWFDVDSLRLENPGMTWVRDRRYVVDRGVVTTTGVSASLPVALALVEATAGAATARALADELGAPSWEAGHDSAFFRDAGLGFVLVVAGNSAARWAQEVVEIPVQDGVDELALAFTADAWSRTYRSTAHARLGSHDRVVTHSGLTLLRTQESPAEQLATHRSEPAVDPVHPARSLQRALDGVDAHHGRQTRDWVARQLEFPVE